MAETNTAQVVVLGGGPGGYAAAFAAADLGLQVTLIDTEANPGGTCLYRGCIPSKALLNVAKLLSDVRQASSWGITFGEPKIDVDKLRAWKDGVVTRLTNGTGMLTKQRKIEYVQGRGKLLSNRRVQVELAEGGLREIDFEYAILATGSRAVQLPGLDYESPRIMLAKDALNLPDIPERLLVIGGGYIGLELGSVYAALGSKVTVAEMMPTLLPDADRDLVSVLSRSLSKSFEAILLKTKVTEVTVEGEKVRVRFEGEGIDQPEQVFDRVLVAVGRRPNTENIGLENTKIQVDERGFIPTDVQRRTAEPNIFAIGDITHGPMLAHKASHEGRVAAEVIAGKNSAFEPKVIPAVVFTDPELAWCGLTEAKAKEEGRDVKVVRFPWGASGRALTLDRVDGVTKLIVDSETEQILGAGIVGPGAGELIGEAILAIEMAAVPADLEWSIHPHPTLSETIMEAAQGVFGQSTHVYRPKR